MRVKNSDSNQSARRSWWLIVGLMLLVAFFFSLILLVTSPQSLAVDVGQLEDVTGGVVPINVRLRSPDYVLFYPPSFHVLGIRRRATQSVETLIQQLMYDGVLSEAEVQDAFEPLRRLSQ